MLSGLSPDTKGLSRVESGPARHRRAPLESAAPLSAREECSQGLQQALALPSYGAPRTVSLQASVCVWSVVLEKQLGWEAPDLGNKTLGHHPNPLALSGSRSQIL